MGRTIKIPEATAAPVFEQSSRAAGPQAGETISSDTVVKFGVVAESAIVAGVVDWKQVRKRRRSWWSLGVQGLGAALFGSPEAERLEAAVRRATVRIEARAADYGDRERPQWHVEAAAHIEAAQDYLTRRRYENGWEALQAAKLAMLSSETDPGRIRNMASEARREAAAKLAGWRLRAVNDALCNKRGRIRKDIAKDLQSVVDALALLDDQFNTTRHKIALRKRHLKNITAFMAFTLVILLVAARHNALPKPLSDPWFLLAIMGCGMIGAILSVAHSTMRADLESRIPSQILGSFLIWMRPVVGATAAVCAALALQLNEVIPLFNKSLTSNPSFVIGIALLSGFSERFIIGTLHQFSERIQQHSS